MHKIMCAHNRIIPRSLVLAAAELMCDLPTLDDNEDKDEVLSAMEEEESSLSGSEDEDIISSIRPSKKVIYSSESEDNSEKPSDGKSLLTYCCNSLVFPVSLGRVDIMYL